MPLSPAESALLIQYQGALTTLLTPGGTVAEVTSNGRTVKYHKTDIAALERQIARLETAQSGARRRGAVSFRL